VSLLFLFVSMDGHVVGVGSHFAGAIADDCVSLSFFFCGRKG
jgi:hypothetical protein